jgi:hypothetical protein
MDLKNRLKSSKVTICFAISFHSPYFDQLEKNIDGHTLLRLTDEDISQLFSEVHEDGTIQEPTIGVKSRFRILLEEWKMNNHNNE